MSYVLALDQGTTSSRAIIFDHDANIVAVGHFPAEGLRPPDSPTRSLARSCAGALRSRGSLATYVPGSCVSLPLEPFGGCRMSYVLALDQGTTSSRAIIFDHDANIVAVGQREFPQIFPRPGWVEHDPGEIWATQIAVATEALGRAHLRPRDITAIGITNQRETTVVWDRETGAPIYNAIVWQDRRTAEFCDRLKRD